MSPIYVRPAREQAEHDRLIHFLEAQFKSKFEVLTNRGEARDYALKVGEGTYFPDLILQDGKKLAGVIEIETGESTNNLEALAQWVHFGRSKAPFYLYVPVLMYDAARRFCDLNQVAVTEIWTYRGLMDGFELLRVFHDPQAVAKSGKGAPAKVVVMPKSVEAPRPEPVAELIEEVVRLGQKAEAARAARREASRPSKVTVVKAADAKPAKPAKAAPAEKPAEPAKAAPKPEPARKPEPAKKPEPVKKPEPAKKPVAAGKPAVKKVAPAKKPAVAARKPQPAAKPVKKPVAAKKAKPVKKTAPVKKAKPAKKVAAKKKR